MQNFTDHPDMGTQKTTLLFSDLLDMWLKTNEVRQKKSTVYKYKSLIGTHILPELGNRPLQEITAPLINEYLNRKLESGRVDGTGGLSPAYVSTIMIIIHSALRFGLQEGLPIPLYSKIYKPAAQKRTLSLLAPHDQMCLEAAIQRNPTPANVGVMISLYTGLRVGEICALRWEDMTLSGALMHVRHTLARVADPAGNRASLWIIDSPKTTASYRDIPLPSKLLPLLKALKQVSRSPFVVSDKESFACPRSYEARFQRLLKECGIERINYHVLRHTFATRLLQAGVDIKTLSELLGHANTSVTLNVYAHTSLDQKRQQIEKLSSPLLL